MISIIMPAFMADRYIERAIKSVLEQSYTKWELMIVNDGSSDKTEEIVFRYRNQDARIKYYYQPNAGQSKARNLALKNAQGNLIAYLDSDDVMLPNHLEIRQQLLEQERVDLVYGPILEVKGKTKKIFHGDLSDTDNGCVMPMMVMHTKRCLQVGGFDEDLVFEEDLEFFLRINKYFKSHQFLEPVTVEYHIHGKGIHSLFSRNGEVEILKFRNQFKLE